MPFLKRLKGLKRDGEHLCSRQFGGYEVHLYIFRGLYVEAWSYIAIRQVLWIEPLRNKEAWKEYLEEMRSLDELPRMLDDEDQDQDENNH